MEGWVRPWFWASDRFGWIWRCWKEGFRGSGGEYALCACVNVRICCLEGLCMLHVCMDTLGVYGARLYGPPGRFPANMDTLLYVCVFILGGGCVQRIWTPWLCALLCVHPVWLVPSVWLAFCMCAGGFGADLPLLYRTLYVGSPGSFWKWTPRCMYVFLY